jgi:Domain of unknown function (DUF4280)
MGQLVVMGAMMQCTMGVAPGTLMVLPTNKVNGSNVPAANIMDYKPIVNITTFGMCQSPSNPVVAAATAAAMGVLTPMPCVPMTSAPWTPGASKTMIGNMPALTNSCTCQCSYGGTISITNAGQTKIMAS